MVLAFFGHEIDDQDVLNLFREQRKAKKKPSMWSKLKGFFNMLHMLFTGPTNVLKTVKQYMHDMKYDMVAIVRNGQSSKDVLENIENEYAQVSQVQFKNHGPCSMGSTFKNMLLRKTLEGAMS